ncbi:MAG TPA: AMP-binding protein [Deltaproteobacteria bacterium]|nr:AMP-binding protein [Deltaproteobacteria bacterium]
MDTLAYRQTLRKLIIARDVALTMARFMREERRRGTLWTNLKGLPKGTINRDMSWAELLEERADQVPEKTFLLYNDERITYRQMDINANRTANLLLKLGGGKGKGLGIFVKNSPRYLDVFFGAQKIGMYAVPLNAELKGDGLRYVIDHSDIEYLALDAELLEPFLAVKDTLPKLKQVIVNDCEPEGQGIAIPEGMSRLSESHTLSSANPGIGYNPQDICLIMYTSGTTGRAKGVVYRYSCTNVKKLGLLSGVFIKQDDIYFTPLPLFHANAMFLTITFSLAAKATVALSRKFSASRFWDEIRRHNATVFNAIGSMVPILMKQPPRPDDSHNQVRYVLSAACPADMWEDFEKRFGLTVYEGYGAVDGGGKVIMNIGTAPVGSIGKPSKGIGKYRLVDEQGRDVPPGVPGELIFKVGSSKGSLEYYKNETATNDKLKDGWLYTGDLIRADERGYLYFVGRNTESMRKGGENVSAYEVEHVIMDHPAVEEVAVYAVPSELAEDEIMASVKLVEGMRLEPSELVAFLKDKLARFAIPRYVRFVDEFPMTSTHRIMKKELEKIGVTPDTYDAQKA